MPPVSPLRTFLGLPTLGGWLTILNCLGWAAVQGYAPLFQHEGMPLAMRGLLIVCFFVISVPLAILLWLPPFGAGLHLPDVLTMSVTVGLNALIWGYGLARIIRIGPPRPNRDPPPEHPTPPAVDPPAPRP